MSCGLLQMVPDVPQPAINLALSDSGNVYHFEGPVGLAAKKKHDVIKLFLKNFEKKAIDGKSKTRSLFY